VIPKKRFVTLDKVTPDYSGAIGAALPKIAAAILKATGASNFNILQNNGRPAHQEVGHVHFHIIPKHDDGSGLMTKGKSFWPSKPLDKAAAAVLAEKIAQNIKAADEAGKEGEPTTESASKEQSDL